MFKGAFTAIVTPFKDGQLDEDGFRALIRAQIEGGIDGIVPCGTTGESATLSHEEHNRVIDIVVSECAGRIPVIAGTGSNSTDETIRLTRHAVGAGADAALLITPYYNKPSQRGLFEHYKAVAASCDIPIILYNVPSRTSVNMLPETTARLAEIDNIVGIKEATGNLEQVSETIRLTPDDFCILSGDDASTLPIIAVAGNGVISVTANLAPQEVSDMCSLALLGEMAEARKLHYRLLPLSIAMFLDTNPVPVKTALAMTGIIKEEFRLPLAPLSASNKEKLSKALKEYGII